MSLFWVPQLGCIVFKSSLPGYVVIQASFKFSGSQSSLFEESECYLWSCNNFSSFKTRLGTRPEPGSFKHVSFTEGVVVVFLPMMKGEKNLWLCGQSYSCEHRA